jgi:cell division inhibitor SulA
VRKKEQIMLEITAMNIYCIKIQYINKVRETIMLNTNMSYNKNQGSPLHSGDWLQLANVNNHQELTSHYATICQQHDQEKKWVLFINPEESSLEQLAQTHGVDISKVLCVSFKGKNKTQHLCDENSAHLDVDQIKKVLCRGNCSAVILSNANFSADDMVILDQSARVGETQCIVLKNQRVNQSNKNTKIIH